MIKEKFDFYDKTVLKSYDLDSTARYQLKMLDSLDNFTRKHSESVANITCRICDYLHLNKDFTIYCTTCAYLHDIGKMFIPPSILQKPAKLTDEEYEIMKTHTTIGYKMCMNDLNLRPYSAGAKYHHEALNGKGYPEGLAGDKIPIEAQIIRVADEFDAIVSKRQYKSHIGIVDTLKILIKNAHNGKNNLPATKALKKVVIDDTIYEISSTFNYVDYLKENIKRLKQIKKYHDKMISASSEKQKNYYLEGMKLLFIAGETVDNCVSILADYENALSEKEKIIDKLNDELKEIKKLKI
ncbi:MAG: HD-GYP domain-containing protein [Clostridia bacterium]